jgi:GTP-binding protein Era
VKDKGELFPLIEWWGGAAPFSAIVPTTATRKKGLDGLIREILRHMPEQAPLYGPDVLTDRTERFIASEYIREQLFLRLREELPYSTAVVIDRWEDRERGDVMIDATIVVERESQKAIVVGKKGEMIRDVGTEARKEIATFLDRPAHLRLYVKVQEGWSSTEAGLADMGYSEDDK